MKLLFEVKDEFVAKGEFAIGIKSIGSGMWIIEAKKEWAENAAKYLLSADNYLSKINKTHLKITGVIESLYLISLDVASVARGKSDLDFAFMGYCQKYGRQSKSFDDTEKYLNEFLDKITACLASRTQKVNEYLRSLYIEDGVRR